MASKLNKAILIWQVIQVSGETVYNVLLLGRTGVGKSDTGCLMVNEKVFKVSDSMLSVTKTCQMATVLRDGVRLNIVDTPGMFDTDMSIQDTIREISEVAFLAPNGFHVLILQIDPFRFTQQEGLTLEYIKHITGGARARIPRTMCRFCGCSGRQAHDPHAQRWRPLEQGALSRRGSSWQGARTSA